MPFPRRGEIWLVALDPIIGSEIGKTRPGLIISHDRGNQYSEIVTVIPLTSKVEKIYPFEALLEVRETGLKHDSKAKCNQIRALDKSRLVKKLGALGSDKMETVERALAVHLDLQMGDSIGS
jgi:mRNA interferase MazF